MHKLIRQNLEYEFEDLGLKLAVHKSGLNGTLYTPEEEKRAIERICFIAECLDQDDERIEHLEIIEPQNQNSHNKTTSDEEVTNPLIRDQLTHFVDTLLGREDLE